MKAIVGFIIFIVVGFYVVGCDNVGFDSVPKVTCDGAERDQDTECFTGSNTIKLSFTFRVGDVDILFVNDNSGSMFVEQKKMASAFPNFIDKISDFNFQLAMITTDISASPNNSTPRAANGNGAFQDGKFLEFTDDKKNKSGLYVLDQNTPNLKSLFKGTIERTESIVCDNHGFAPEYCPSSDERGIYALNLAVERGEKKFFRPGAHLAIVILSDEDERSNGGKMEGYELEPNDKPATLVLNMSNYYPTKSFSVHSIVTNNSTCAEQQEQYSDGNPWPTLGYIGSRYMALSNPSANLKKLGNIAKGVVGSICSSNYSSQMGNIGKNVAQDTLNSPKQLACALEPDRMSIVTKPTGFESQITYDVDSNNRITFGNVPIGVEVTFAYECDRY